MAKNRKTLVFVLAAVGLALLGFAGFFAVWWWQEKQFQKTWDSRVSELREAGIPTEKDEFFPQAPTNDRNAAPLIEQAVALHSELKESVESEFNPFSPGGSEWKDVAQDSERRARVFEAWNTPRMNEILRLVGEATLLPDFYVERDYSSPLTMDLKPVTSTLSLGQLLSARSNLLAHEGRVQEAWEIIPILFRLSDFASSEPILISMLVGMSIERMALAGIENILQLRAVNDLSVEQLEEMSKVLASREAEIFPKAIKAMDGERVLFGGAIFEMLRDRKLSMAEITRQVVGSGNVDIRRNLWLELAGFIYTRPLFFFLNNDQLSWLDFHCRFRETLQNPFDADGVFIHADKGALHEEIPKSAILTRLATPVLEGIAMMCMVQVEEMRLGQLAIATTIFAREHGRWPADLNELVEVAPGVPLRDRFTGNNFAMHEEEGGLLFKSGAYDWSDDRISKNRRKGLSWHMR